MAALNKSSLQEIRKILKENILNNENFIGYNNEKEQVLDLIQRTVKFGESNSALLIGPKGTGKTMMVLNVLEELQSNALFVKDSMLVKLHGLIHTDDRLSLKSITSQMNLDNVVDGKVFGTFAENLSFLLACLRTGDCQTSKSVIFILEDFDLFCFHHNQTLLYNLFDISQSAQAPICVLGITCRLDVIELLEKRVKSRFSHRQIFLFPDIGDTNKPLDYMLTRIKYYLTLYDSRNNKVTKEVKKTWNFSVENLLKNKQFKSVIQRFADIDISERGLKNLLTKIVFKMDNYLSIKMFQDELNALEHDDMLLILQDLNVLELCLLIAMKHHTEIYDGQSMNYEMILSRYNTFAKINSHMQNVSRSVVMKAFEHIQSLELISMVSGGSKTQKEYQFFNLLIMPSQIDEAIKQTPGLPTEIMQWANSSLGY